VSLTNFVDDVQFEEYRERLKEHFFMQRKGGIIEVRMHTCGGEAQWGFELHRALGQMFHFVGADRKNEVMILTATGDNWIRTFDIDSFMAGEKDDATFKSISYDYEYYDTLKLQENLLWDVDIPTIACVNGPGMHTEFSLLCDITLCSETAKFVEPHWGIKLVPGDGMYLVFEEVLGKKRANYLMYMNEPVSDKKALDWGLVNEVLPKEKLLPRAWEIAEQLMKAERTTRRLTTSVVKRRWRRLFTDDFSMHAGTEIYAMMLADLQGRAHYKTPVKGFVDKEPNEN